MCDSERRTHQHHHNKQTPNKTLLALTVGEGTIRAVHANVCCHRGRVMNCPVQHHHPLLLRCWRPCCLPPDPAAAETVVLVAAAPAHAAFCSGPRA